MAPTNEVSLSVSQALNQYRLTTFIKAFERVSSPVLKQLSLPQNYPLLLSIIRSHFIEGELKNETFQRSQGVIGSFKSADGQNISISSDTNGEFIYNSKMTGFRYASISNKSKASNGIIFKIDRAINPFDSVFGAHAASETLPQTIIDKSPRQENKTMTDVVLAEPKLARWTSLMQEVLPAILKRLGDRRGPEGSQCRTPHPFVMLPSNDAMAMLGADYTNVLRAPFNFALSSHLLAWGISVPTCSTFDDIMSRIRKDGGFTIFSHRADINITIRESAPGSGTLLANNARVEFANKCAANGCVWIVDRMIDPLYGLF